MITRKDLSSIILSIKKQMGWTYTEMGQKTNIYGRTLNRYAKGDMFPRDPEKVINALRNAVRQEMKKRRATNQ